MLTACEKADYSKLLTIEQDNIKKQARNDTNLLFL